MPTPMIVLLSRWQLLVRILSFVAAVGGTFSLPFTLKPFGEWGTAGYALLVVSGVFLAVGIVLEVRSEASREVFARHNVRGIRDYMYRWIRDGGLVAVWTRDHSWVNDDEMRELLLGKAKRRELIFCVPHETDFSNALAQAGAEVIVHKFGDLKVRFTITNYNKDTFALALARPNSRAHLIEEYSSATPSAAMARDLIELARSKQGQS